MDLKALQQRGRRSNDRRDELHPILARTTTRWTSPGRFRRTMEELDAAITAKLAAPPATR